MVEVRIPLYFEFQKVSFSTSNVRPSVAKPIETEPRKTNLTVLDPTYRHQAYLLLGNCICRLVRFDRYLSAWLSPRPKSLPLQLHAYAAEKRHQASL